MTPTVLYYRVPDNPDLLLQMMDGVEADGGLPLAVMPVREQLWCRAGPSARLSARLSRNVGVVAAEVGL